MSFRQSGGQGGCPAPVQSRGPECVDGVDVVNVITTAARPVLLGEWLSAGAHVNASGNNHWMKQEVDSEVVRRASVLVADDVDDARIECGDLVEPIDRGITTWNHVRNLSDVVTGQVAGRASDDDVTLFESQGLAIEDIAVGIRVSHAAREVASVLGVAADEGAAILAAGALAVAAASGKEALGLSGGRCLARWRRSRKANPPSMDYWTTRLGNSQTIGQRKCHPIAPSTYSRTYPLSSPVRTHGRTRFPGFAISVDIVRWPVFAAYPIDYDDNRLLVLYRIPRS